MSKTRIFALIDIVILLAAVLTNPSVEKHQAVVSKRAKILLEKQFEYKDADAVQLGMTLFGDRIIEEFIQSSVQTKNYYLFSLTTVRWESKETTIGIGAFGKVWITEQMDEEANKVLEALKKI